MTEIAQRTLNFAEMIETDDGLFRLGEVYLFDYFSAQNCSVTSKACPSAQGVAFWRQWMVEQGNEVVELPPTERTRGWGRVFSITLMEGGDSRVYALEG